MNSRDLARDRNRLSKASSPRRSLCRRRCLFERLEDRWLLTATAKDLLFEDYVDVFREHIDTRAETEHLIGTLSSSVKLDAFVKILAASTVPAPPVAAVLKGVAVAMDFLNTKGHFGISIDLSDLLGLTQDSKDGYVTVFLSSGMTLVDLKLDPIDNLLDSRFSVELSLATATRKEGSTEPDLDSASLMTLSGNYAGIASSVSVPSWGKVESGNSLSIDPLSDDLWAPDAGVEFLSFDWNFFSFDVKTDALWHLLGSTAFGAFSFFKDVAESALGYSLPDSWYPTTMVDVLASFSGVSRPPIIRDAEAEMISARFAGRSGGFDLNGDGVGDWHFPVFIGDTPPTDATNKPWFTATIDVTNTGAKDAKFTVQAAGIPNGWTVHTDGFRRNSHRNLQIKQGETGTSRWIIGATPDARPGQVTFYLFHSSFLGLSKRILGAYTVSLWGDDSDELSGATDVTPFVNQGERQHFGQLHGPSDPDYLKFRAPANGRATITVSPYTQWPDILLTAYDANGQQLGASDSGGHGGSERLIIDTDADATYYVRIRPGANYTHSTNVANHFYTVQIVCDAVYYWIVPEVSTKGEITDEAGNPLRSFELGAGASHTFYAKPDEGYRIDNWYVNGQRQPDRAGKNSYTLTKVRQDTRVYVSFLKASNSRLMVTYPAKDPFTTSAADIEAEGVAPEGTHHVSWHNANNNHSGSRVPEGLLWWHRISLRDGINRITLYAWADQAETQLLDQTTITVTRTSAGRVVSISAAVDTYIASSKPKTPLDAGFVYVGVHPPEMGVQYGLLAFDLPDFPPGATFQGATLSGEVRGGTSPNDDDLSIRAHRINLDWNRSHATWNNTIRSAEVDNQDFYVSNNSSAIPIGLARRYVFWDVEGIVDYWFHDPSRNHGFLLRSDASRVWEENERYFTNGGFQLEIDYAVEQVKPTISIAAANPVYSQSSPLRLTGTADDNEQLSQVVCANWTTGASGTVTGTRFWTCDVALAAGENRIVVTAIDASGNEESDAITAYLLAPPSNVVASDDQQDRVQVSWEESAGATHYRVYRADSETGSKTAVSSWLPELTFFDNPPEMGNEYFYWVTAAVDATGSHASGYSQFAVGREGQPEIRLEPSSVDFGRVVNNTAGIRTLTIHNDGPVNLVIYEAAGLEFPFSFLPAAGPTVDEPWRIAPRGSLEVVLRFDPQVGGAVEGTLTFLCNDPIVQQALVPLSGAGNVAPIVSIDRIDPSEAVSGDTVQLRGTAHDADGTIQTVEWWSDLDGFLGDSVSLDLDAFKMTVGEHRITFWAMDNEGARSSIASGSLIIQNAVPTASLAGLPVGTVATNSTVAVILTGTDNDEEGHEIVAWQLLLDGEPVTVPQLGKVELTMPGTPGDYAIKFRVQDDEETWSDWASGVIRVANPHNVNAPPHMPFCVYPVPNAAQVPLAPLLRSSAFHDPDPDDYHLISQWQVARDPGFAYPIWSTYDYFGDKTSEQVPNARLSYETSYWWRVRHSDNNGLWSPWSPSCQFTTQAPDNRKPFAPQPVSPVSGQLVTLTPILIASEFTDPNPGDQHRATHWQVASDWSFQDVVWSQWDLGLDKVQEPVPEGILAFATRYYWRARYQDDRYAWSDWSQPAGFETNRSSWSEPNDSWQTATNLGIVEGEIDFTGFEIVLGDVDYYRFTITATGRDCFCDYVMLFGMDSGMGANNLALSLGRVDDLDQLVPARGETWAEVSTFEEHFWEELLLEGLPAGEYYAIVYGASGLSESEANLPGLVNPDFSGTETGSYQLAIGAPMIDAYEPDDEWYQASLISTDGTAQQHSLSRTDVDWVKFMLEAPSEVVVQSRQLVGSRGNDAISMRMALFGPDDPTRLVRTVSSRAGDITLRLEGQDALEPGTYYARFYKSVVNAISHYTIQVFASPPPPMVTIMDAKIVEGDVGVKTLDFPVFLSRPAEEDVWIEYRTESGTAEAGLDFVSVAGRLLIPTGQEHGTIGVEIIGDLEPESHEAFFVLLTDVQGARIVREQAIGLIFDDDRGGWRNPADPHDVDGDGYVTPKDVLILINFINGNPRGLPLSEVFRASPHYYDVNGDGYCTPLDALKVINRINLMAASRGEGELDERIIPQMNAHDPVPAFWSPLLLNSNTARQNTIDVSFSPTATTLQADSHLVSSSREITLFPGSNSQHKPFPSEELEMRTIRDASHRYEATILPEFDFVLRDIAEHVAKVWSRGMRKEV